MLPQFVACRPPQASVNTNTIDTNMASRILDKETVDRRSKLPEVIC
ncbi:MAG TPA: hypothetical protein VG759_23215 [Candidatus Angelobacter sp.]|nr:hypothetical protein [Candidatus Angelobacter sp.]